MSQDHESSTRSRRIGQAGVLLLLAATLLPPGRPGLAQSTELPGKGDTPASRAAGPPGSSFDAHAVFTEANRAFDSARAEDLERAAAGYERLLQNGIRNGRVYYNLGYSYFRLGDPGRAILNFRRVFLYDPGNEYATLMLERAREAVRDRFTASGQSRLLTTLFFWHFESAFSTRLWALTLVLLGFWSLLALRLYRRLPLQRLATGLLAVLALTLATSLGTELLLERGEPAVVVASEAEVRAGNGSDYPPVFEEPVKSGVEVRILDTRGNWHQVEFPGGTVGWIPRSAVEAVRFDSL